MNRRQKQTSLDMSFRQRDQQAYKLARQFVRLELHLPDQILIEHLDPAPATMRPNDVAGIYKRLLISASSAGMGPKVIRRPIGDFNRLGKVLSKFEPNRVVKKFGDNWRQVLHEIRRTLNPAGQIRETKRSLWPQFCRAIVSGAKFLNQFNSAEEFYRWAESIYADPRARPALPMLLAREIDGVGFALACDFLKEIGYTEYAKPDVHLIAIFKQLKLCSQSASQYEVYKAIIRLAANAKVSAYHADKLFWLISARGSEINGVKIGGQRNEFITYALKHMPA